MKYSVLVVLLTVVTNALKFDQLKLLKALNYHKIDPDLSQRLITEIDNALNAHNDEATFTGFIGAYECTAIKAALQEQPIECTYSGGYPTAKRKMAVFTKEAKQTRSNTDGKISIRDDRIAKKSARDATVPVITALSIRGEFKEKNVSLSVDVIRSALESVTQTENVGDILIQDRNEAQVLISAKFSNDLFGEGDTPGSIAMKDIKGVPIEVKRIELNDIAAPVTISKQVILIENNLRLDAIVSAGFSVSRNQMTKHIAEGLISIDDKLVSSGTIKLRSNQVCTFRDKATFQIDNIETTSKGKYRIYGTRNKLDQRKKTE